MSPKRPVLRYFGGKWLLAPWIIEQFPPHRVYVEPFGGAASVLLRKRRSYAEIWNDLDDQVVGLFSVLRDDEQATQLVKLLELTPFSRKDFEISLEWSDNLIERSRRLVVRSFFGYGSDSATGRGCGQMRTGFRNDSNRSGGTPARDWRNYPDALRLAIERLRGVVIEHRPACKVIEQFDTPDTLFYCDPPYVHSTRSARDHGYRHEMTDDDHTVLAAQLNQIQGFAIVSGYGTDLYDELYSGWYRVERQTQVLGTAGRTEYLWLSPKTTAARRAGSLL